MKIVNHAARVVLGLMFTVFGLNYFLHFIALPPMPGAGGEFMGTMVSSGLLSLVKVIEVVAGLLLLTGVQVPLALLLLTPLTIVIVFFHSTIGGPNPLAYVSLLLIGYLAYVYKNNFANIFNTNNAWTALD